MIPITEPITVKCPACNSTFIQKTGEGETINSLKFRILKHIRQTEDKEHGGKNRVPRSLRITVESLLREKKEEREDSSGDYIDIEEFSDLSSDERKEFVLEYIEEEDKVTIEGLGRRVFGKLVTSGTKGYSLILNTLQKLVEDGKLAKASPPGTRSNIYELSTKERITKEETADEEEQKPECPYCGSTYSFYSSLSKHIRDNHEEESKNSRFVCDICGLAKTNRNAMARHIHGKHDKSSEGLTYRFSTLEWEKETDEDDEDRYMCPKCKNLYKNQQAFVGHMTQHSPDEREWIQSRVDIENMRRATTGDKDKEEQEIKKDKDVELKTPPEPVMPVWNKQGSGAEEGKLCVHCFEYWVNLKEHMKSKHGYREEAPFVCALCDTEFDTSSGIATHISKGHGRGGWDVSLFYSKKFFDGDIGDGTYEIESHDENNIYVRFPEAEEGDEEETGEDREESEEEVETYEDDRIECPVCGGKFDTKAIFVDHSTIHVDEMFGTEDEKEEYVPLTSSGRENEVKTVKLRAEKEETGDDTLDIRIDIEGSITEDALEVVKALIG